MSPSFSILVLSVWQTDSFLLHPSTQMDYSNSQYKTDSDETHQHIVNVRIRKLVVVMLWCEIPPLILFSLFKHWSYPFVWELAGLLFVIGVLLFSQHLQMRFEDRRRLLVWEVCMSGTAYLFVFWFWLTYAHRNPLLNTYEFYVYLCISYICIFSYVYIWCLNTTT